jgi:hypothetical protein
MPSADRQENVGLLSADQRGRHRPLQSGPGRHHRDRAAVRPGWHDHDAVGNAMGAFVCDALGPAGHFRWKHDGLGGATTGNQHPANRLRASFRSNRSRLCREPCPTGRQHHRLCPPRAIAAKWVEVLTEVAPRTARVGVIYDPVNAAQTYIPDIEGALSPGMQLAPYAVQSRSELEEAIERIGGEPNGALIVLSGSLTALSSSYWRSSTVCH